MTSDDIFIREALKEAALAKEAGDWGIGSIVTQGDKIIARGRNRIFSQRNRLLHAEIQALNDIQRDHFDRQDKNLVLYTTYEMCPMCFGATLYAGIHRVVCGVDFDKSGASTYLDELPEFFKQSTYQTSITVGVLARKCAEMWLSSQPAQRMVKGGYVLPKTLESLDETKPKTYSTIR